MDERYYNNPAVIKESAHVLRAAEPGEDGLSIFVPDTLLKVIHQEAFYCRAQDDEMPYRIVLHGSSIGALAERGAHIGFEVDCGSSGNTGGASAPRVRRLPFTHPMPGETGSVRAVAGSMIDASTTEAGVSLDPIALSMLRSQSEKNGLSVIENFIALTGLINFIGTSEREGMLLTISE